MNNLARGQSFTLPSNRLKLKEAPHLSVTTKAEPEWWCGCPGRELGNKVLHVDKAIKESCILILVSSRFYTHVLSQAWQLLSIISALRTLRLEDCFVFEASLAYTVSCGLAWNARDFQRQHQFFSQAKFLSTELEKRMC